MKGITRTRQAWIWWDGTRIHYEQRVSETTYGRMRSNTSNDTTRIKTGGEPKQKGLSQDTSSVTQERVNQCVDKYGYR